MYILFDIGGTKTRVIGTRDLKTFASEPTVFKTHKNYDEGARLLAETIKKAAGNESIETIGGGIAGPVDQKTGRIVGGRNLQGWFKKPLRDDLKREFNVPVYIENDAALVGLGEMHYGAGSTKGIGVYLTVSTGVGGARYEGGVIDKKTLGFEPGTQIIDPDRTLCPDCESGELESYIGGAATERRMGKKPYDIVDPAFWDTYAKYLAYGLNNIIALWSPDFIVLGGSMIAGDPAISVSKVKEHLKNILTIFPVLPSIKKAELGDLGGLYGAMVFIEQSQKI